MTHISLFVTQIVRSGVGELYVLGALDTPYSLLPPPSYPTPRDTPSLSSTVATGWNHQFQLVFKIYITLLNHSTLTVCKYTVKCKASGEIINSAGGKHFKIYRNGPKIIAFNPKNIFTYLGASYE